MSELGRKIWGLNRRERERVSVVVTELGRKIWGLNRRERVREKGLGSEQRRGRERAK